MLDNGLDGQGVLVTKSQDTEFEEHSDAVTKDLNNLKITVLLKLRGCGRVASRGGPRGRGNYCGGGGFRGSRGTRGGHRGSCGGHNGRDNIITEGRRGGQGGQHSGGRGVAQHVYVEPTAFENAKELLAGLCYACGSPDHRSHSGYAACSRGPAIARPWQPEGGLQVTIQEQHSTRLLRRRPSPLTLKQRISVQLMSTILRLVCVVSCPHTPCPMICM